MANLKNGMANRYRLSGGLRRDQNAETVKRFTAL